MAAISKINAKGQTTVPKQVQAALQSGPGDLLAWDIGEDGRVVVRRVGRIDSEYQGSVESSLSEWHSAEDEAAYRDL